MKKLFLILLSLVFISCGITPGTNTGSTNPSLAEISGVWDKSRTQGQVVDEGYLVIKNTGTGTDYNYLGDSFDSGDNCYSRTNQIITDLGNGNFSVVYDNADYDVFLASLLGNNLIITYIEGVKYDRGGLTIRTYTRTTLQETYFVPICSV